MTGPVLALSPHLDDAAFSAGGALAARARAGDDVTVATLFAGNVAAPRGFALACQLDKGLDASVDYMALRRAEDEAACATLGVRALHLPLLEAPHRGYGDARALFAPPHPDDPVADALAGTVAGLLRRHGAAEIWAPRALGGHVDHVLLHRAVRDLAPAAGVRWWTDWPYADRASPPDPEAATVAGLAWDDRPLDDEGRRRKADACAAYLSQLGFQFGGEAALRDRVSRQAAERFAVARSS